ncbi:MULTISPECIES: PQQ-dependent sugar dehydrogenase [unclassified Novosphingobium]|uniref:PQQ-dependent sugar dehydrogenase n=1 Tax=unclassified Novosphingobium TaxID=2644732 RepID=UPI000D307A4D|nr:MULTISPECIES: PQQ-dependent sugar dehydrogenase [unclassified Novosphingobium]PTR11714.1 glucose/arabinose dehydrogenase [Novosphingobium sp. GV055]PUB04754.1 glucose/arabinose dehydrogenase [Novosphingobium sp. GV061]PUB21073.1 glucose/arabinose dehydrogenase [Novosphingobium sp. GV079]PUB42799.1 glucose/arabinose dehydrogenase [Novosphingobium sp. GV027]
MTKGILCLLSPLAFLAASCGSQAQPDNDAATAPEQRDGFVITDLARFDSPWAMVFLPDDGQGKTAMLVTERTGALKLWREGAKAVIVSGTPKVDAGGQGGLGDIALAPDFATSGLVYLTWVEAGAGDTRGAVLGRARLVRDQGSPRLEGLTVIWRQVPKVSGRGHFGHRIAFAPDGKSLFLSSGERQKFTPAQDMTTNLGKILHLTLDGQPAPGNPFVAQGGIAAQVWTLGHRNPLGLQFDAQGRLWDLEHGPAGGDELNLLSPGKNYGWPLVSDGDNYDGTPIPRNATRPDLAAPAISWNPVIAPGDFVFYSGKAFPQWRGQALIAALGAAGIVRVGLEPGPDGRPVGKELERIDLGTRIREIREARDGTLWILEDGENARLRRLAPR